MLIPELYPQKIEIYRGTDHKLYFEILDSSTKLPVNYSGHTFSAILIDQQDVDYKILATYSLDAATCITACTATLCFKLSSLSTASISEDIAYLRIYQIDLNNDKSLFIYGNVEIKV